MCKRFISALALILAIGSLTSYSQTTTKPDAPKHTKAAPTLAEAEKFMADTEAQLEDLAIKGSRAAWVSPTSSPTTPK